MPLSKLPLFVAGMLLASVTPSAAGAPHPFEVGQPFPDLMLPRLGDHRPSSLADFRGKRVVLHVFASW